MRKFLLLLRCLVRNRFIFSRILLIMRCLEFLARLVKISLSSSLEVLFIPELLLFVQSMSRLPRIQGELLLLGLCTILGRSQRGCHSGSKLIVFPRYLLHR